MVYILTIVSYILYIIFSVVYGDITLNPSIVSNKIYQIDFTIIFEKLSVKVPTSGYYIKNYKQLVINQEYYDAKIEGKYYLFSSNLFLCIDKSKKYFLLIGNNYYTVNVKIGSTIEINYLSLKISLPSNIQYYGYNAEIKFEEYIEKIGRCGVSENELIIYGIKDRNIYFYYTLEKEGYQLTIDLIEELSCKLLESDLYICAYSFSNKIYISFISHQYILDGNKAKRSLTSLTNQEIPEFAGYKKPILYDTNDKNYKILCAKKEKILLCKALHITFYYAPLLFKFQCTLNVVNLDTYKVKEKNNENSCYITVFNSEYLSCCKDGDKKISCQRRENEFKLITEFNIGINEPDPIKYLTIESNEDNAIIYYKKKESLYKYSIYIPKCENQIKELNNFHDIEVETFAKKTNSKYFVKFISLPLDKGTFRLNEKKIVSIKDKIELTNEINRLYLDTDISDLIIIYNISIQETYSKICKLELYSKSCYDSCKDCSVGKAKSNDIEHNCDECRENFYPLSSKKSNCYKLDEIGTEGKNFYFNNSDKMFYPCYNKCRNCT